MFALVCALVSCCRIIGCMKLNNAQIRTMGGKKTQLIYFIGLSLVAKTDLPYAECTEKCQPNPLGNPICVHGIKKLTKIAHFTM